MIQRLKPVVWVGLSRKDVRAFPDVVQDLIGYALYVAQQGCRHREIKTLIGFGGAGVVEIITNHRGDTYRTVYTVRYQGTVYVLHAFQKKSTSGRTTPKHDLELIKQRLREAERIAQGARL